MGRSDGQATAALGFARAFGAAHNRLVELRLCTYLHRTKRESISHVTDNGWARGSLAQASSTKGQIGRTQGWEPPIGPVEDQSSHKPSDLPRDKIIHL